MTYKLGDLTRNDTLSLRSILTLPQPIVKFSHINLHETNILERANLNTFFIQYWQLLNTLTKVQTINVYKKKNIFKTYNLLKIHEGLLFAVIPAEGD